MPFGFEIITRLCLLLSPYFLCLAFSADLQGDNNVSWDSEIT